MADGDRVQALVESWAELPELASQDRSIISLFEAVCRIFMCSACFCFGVCKLQDDFLFVPEQGLNDEKQDWEVKEEAVKKTLR
jgi:hypothetical protein